VRLTTALAVVAAGSVLGASLGLGVHAVWPDSPLVEGIYIGERRLPDDESPASWLASRNDALKARELALLIDGEVVHVTWGELGAEVDVLATMRAAEAFGHRGGPLQRLREAHAARRGAIDVPLVVRTSTVATTRLLRALAPSVERAPVDARLDVARRQKVHDVPGRRLDVDGAVTAIEEAVAAGALYAELPIELVEARVTVDQLARVDVAKVVAAWETKYHVFGSGVGRSRNIRAAAARIDGLVLAPGQVLSFNEAVGARTLERGFTWAPEIMGDEMTTGVGGGTCQVSTTLFAAALHAAMGIVERQSHSRPSSYAPLGLDATVSWPNVDLKIRNDLPYPIMIHAFVPEDDLPLHDSIRVEILGGAPVATVSYSYGIARTENFERRITVKEHLAPGKRVRRQKGSRGYSVTSVANLLFADGRVEQRTWFSGYRPAPEVYWVGPGYDERELPPLPDHCDGVEGRGETAQNLVAQTDPFAEM
jgi:vancomycin resistance protein YoaR